jgi:GNAT superfamily N-acetyltransferase
MTASWRPLTEADATEWVRLTEAVEAADRTGEHLSVDDFLELAESSRVALASGSVGVFDGDRMIASGEVWTQPGAIGEHRVRLEGRVHPDVRRTGLGARLLAELERLGHAEHRRVRPDLPLQLAVAGHETNEGKLALIAAAGYEPVRWFSYLACDLADEPPTPSFPDGVHLAPYPDDDEPVRLAINEFFADHWGHHDYTVDTWREYVGGHMFRRDLSLLLCDDAGGIAAAVISNFYPEEFAQTGVRELWISDVGTRESLRGKGLATALLGHTLAKARAAGFDRAGLDVDAANPTGALGVYERCGLRRISGWTYHGKPASAVG